MEAISVSTRKVRREIESKVTDTPEPESVVVEVPSKGTITQEEWASQLASLLSSMGIVCEVNQAGSIVYPDGPEGDELELIIGLTRLFDARFLAIRGDSAR